MSQKSILSFFKASAQPKAKETKKTVVIDDDSPAKKPKSKRKVQSIESDDESPDIPLKKSKNKSETSEASNKVEKSSNLNSVKEKNEVEENGNLSSRKTVVIDSDSPVKKPKSKRKVQRIESDDESSDIPLKEPKNKSETSVTPNKVEKSSNLNSVKEENEVEENGDLSSRPEKKNMENGNMETMENDKMETSENSNMEIAENDNETNSSQSVAKVDLDTSNQKNKVVAENDATSDSSKTEESSSSNQNDCTDFIPKRKTARKQMSSSKRNIPNLKENSISKTDKGEENKGTLASDEDSKSETDKGEENKGTPTSHEDSKSKTDTGGENKSTTVSNEDSNSKTDKGVDLKSTPTSNKTTSLKNKNNKSGSKVENNSCASEDTAEEKSENKELIKVVKVSPDSKRKARATAKDKSSPVKKSSKKESIQNFFAPVTRTKGKGKAEQESKTQNVEDKGETKEDSITKKAEDTSDTKVDSITKKAEDKTDTKEDTKIQESCSNVEANDDSPVKKVKRKRTQVLESDEEEDSDLVSVKKETDNTESENTTTSSQEKEVTKSENSAPEVNKTPTKKQTSENSKSDGTSQKLGIKSTSAGDTEYNPSKHNYHPVEDAFWKKDEKVPYLALAKTLQLIEDTSGRLKTIEILSNYFRSVIVLSPDDLLHSVYLCLNRVAPEYEGIEMGIGETLLMKAVAQATGRTVDKIKAEVAIKGDLGLVSESSRGNQRVMFAPPKLTVSSVFNKFLEIAKMSGNAAMSKKIDKIKSLFIACRDCEAKYIIRSLSGKLRIGMAEQSILSAIAQAAVVTPPGQEYPPKKIDASKGMSTDSFKKLLDAQTLILKTAYCECPNYDLIIPVLLKNGISALPDHCQLSPGVPLKPMLAHPTDGIDRVLERFDKNAFTCEFKYDGERAQIHMNEKGEVKIFSRNQEDNTSKYPDVISRISGAMKESTKSFILDSEAVAWDRATKQILPFQVLSTRKRKDAVESEIVVQVCIMAFDLLYLNGESLVRKPLKERRSLLHSSFNEVENQFMFAQYRDGNSAETMQEFLDESVKGNCEGLMVKSLEVDASYEIAKRSRNWLKLKKDYLQGIGDTIDLVVIGGYYGKGKRTGNYGGFLLACYDEENEEFQSICKLGTGFKDENLEAHTKFLKQHIIKEPKSYFRYDHSLEPDEWFEAVQVWEIKCADLSISPVHKAATGIVDPEKGISLRFPRFIRIRDDKNPEDATNSVQIADMYQRQQQIQNTTNKNAKIEEDYY